MHGVVANDVFRDFGLASAHSTFDALNLNEDGSGDEENEIYYGLYTLVEEVDNFTFSLPAEKLYLQITQRDWLRTI